MSFVLYSHFISIAFTHHICYTYHPSLSLHIYIYRGLNMSTMTTNFLNIASIESYNTFLVKYIINSDETHKLAVSSMDDQSTLLQKSHHTRQLLKRQLKTDQLVQNVGNWNRAFCNSAMVWGYVCLVDSSTTHMKLAARGFNMLFKSLLTRLNTTNTMWSNECIQV